MSLNYRTIITHRPNEFVTWYITESGYIMTSGRSQTVTQAREEAAEYLRDRQRLAESCNHKNIRSTVEVIELD